MGKFRFCQRVTKQIGENEFDTCTDTLVLNENESLSKLKEWAERPKTNYYCWGHIECYYINKDD